MIDIIENYSDFNISSLAPALDEFEASVRKSMIGIDHSDLNQRLTMEAWIYGELIQVLDKRGLRTYGLATGVRKYFSYFVVDVITTEPQPRTIRQIKIPLTKVGQV
ncbi:MAG: hypothetical protein WCY82_03885 [Desulfotomaculaceae bacterium]